MNENESIFAIVNGGNEKTSTMEAVKIRVIMIHAKLGGSNHHVFEVFLAAGRIRATTEAAAT